MLQIHPSTQAAILAELGKPNADVHRVARAYGIPARQIRELQDATNAVVKISSSRFVERFGGMGRPEIQKYIVSRTKVGNGWPEDDAKSIRTARFQYDEGVIDMATGRDGDWLILYAIPRQTRDAERRPYFNRSVGDV